MRAAHVAFGDEHRLFFAGFLLGGLHTIRIFFLIAELQGICFGLGDVNLDKNTPIVQRGEPITRRDRHVVTTACADIEVFSNFTMEQHRAAHIAFVPQIFRCFAT